MPNEIQQAVQEIAITQRLTKLTAQLKLARRQLIQPGTVTTTVAALVLPIVAKKISLAISATHHLPTAAAAAAVAVMCLRALQCCCP